MAPFQTYIICNLKKEHDRFLKIFSQVLSRGIEKESVQVIAPTWEDELSSETIFNVYDPYLYRGHIPPFKSGTASLKEISLVLNYVAVFQHAAAADLDDSAIILVLESGTTLHRQFLPNLQKILEETAWDCVRLIREEDEGTANSFPTGAILFRMGFVRKMLKTILPFRESIDAELRFQVMLHKAKVVMASPPLAARL